MAVCGAVLCVICLWTALGVRTAHAAQPPRPPRGHPRLFLRREHVGALRQWCRRDTGLMEDLLRQADAADDGHLPNGVPENLWRDVRRMSFEANALLYLLDGDARRGRLALRTALDYLSSFTGTYERDGLFVSRAANRGILGAAMVYDWCYQLLTEQEKADFIRHIKRLAENAEHGWPPRGGFVTGHYSEEKNPCMLAAGIAVHDEDPSIYDLMADHLYNGFAPARNFFYRGSKHHQGSSYGVSRFADEVLASFIVTRMGVPNPCVAEQVKVPYFFIYNRRPDGLFMVEGDDYARASRPARYGSGEFLHMLVSLYGDPYIQDEAVRYRPQIRNVVFRILCQHDAVQPKPVSELPLTRYFGPPFGQMIARTGWDVQGGKGAPVAIAKMNIGQYLFGNHQHLDGGHFSIYYKGSLAIDSGVYQGTEGGYGCEHFLNYYQRSVAHNTILVLDSDEPRPRWWGRELQSRDGGQFWPPGRAEYATIDDVVGIGPRAEIIAHQVGPDPLTPDYSYLKGDLAPAYHAPPPYPPKVSEVKRSFVFLNLKDPEHPAALVVFDRVTSRLPSFRKSWLIHSINEPDIEGNMTDIRRTEDDYNGRLVNHTLLPRPDNCRIARVGGPEREFWVDGRNYPQGYRRPGWHEPGAWRIEVSPRQPAATDLFLNVMQVLDAVGGPPPLRPELIETDAFVGARIADRAVLFSQSGRPVEREVTLDLPGAGELSVLVTDIAPGRWRLEGPARFEVDVAPEGGAVYFKGPAGRYRLLPVR